MPSSNVKLTRLELMKNKSRIKIAERGLELLKMKRASLVLAFFNLTKEINLLMGNLKEMIDNSKTSIKLAEIYSGRIQVERIAAEQSNIGISIEAQNIMGVKIPNVKIEDVSEKDISYQLVSIPASVHDAKNHFSKTFKMLIEIAEKENSLRKLLNEIDKLNRRSNAIESMAIPDMKNKVKYINQGLEDIERDQLISLKFIKGKLNEAKQ